MKNCENALALHSCGSLGYVDFLRLSAITMNTSSTYGAAVTLSSCNLSTSEVNHMLVDFDTISTLNPTGWSAVTLDILTGNSSPDSSSGGYDGISAINSLTGSPKNWVII